MNYIIIINLCPVVILSYKNILPMHGFWPAQFIPGTNVERVQKKVEQRCTRVPSCMYITISLGLF